MELTNSDGISFELNSNNFTASVIYSKDAKESITIPHFITYESNNYHVVKISENSFKDNQNIISIEFPEDSELSLIDNYAFSSSSLQNILIPSHVSKIGEFCFSECNNLQTVEFSPQSELKTIGKGAFSYSSISQIRIRTN